MFVVKHRALALSASFASAADTCARTIVEANIWMRCADELIAASASKKASKTWAWLNRSKRFPTLFQGPKRSGRARRRTFSTAKKRFEEASVILGLLSPSWEAGTKYPSVRVRS
jgi:hypothetical protein